LDIEEVFSEDMKIPSDTKTRNSKDSSSRKFDLLYLLLFGGAFFLFFMFNSFVKDVTLVDIFYILLAVLISLYMWIEYGVDVFKKWYGSDNVISVIFLGIVFSILTSIVMILDNILFVGEIVELKGVSFVINLAASVVFGPFIEELIYRGVIMDFLGKWTGKALAIPVSALLFSLAHIPINIVDFMLVFVVGICFGILYTLTRNLIGSTIAHSISNIAVFIFIR
jgi:membrane protease YdiL (CAAX protease family)